MNWSLLESKVLVLREKDLGPLLFRFGAEDGDFVPEEVVLEEVEGPAARGVHQAAVLDQHGQLKGEVQSSSSLNHECNRNSHITAIEPYTVGNG